MFSASILQKSLFVNEEKIEEDTKYLLRLVNKIVDLIYMKQWKSF
jgi:hypothetical protein